MNRKLLIVFWVVLAGCAGREERGELDPFIPGQPALEGIQLELPRLGGGTRALSTLRGKPVLIFLFTTWSLRCQAEAPLLVQLYDTYHSRGLEVLGVAVEQIKPQLIRDYADYVDFRFDILLSLPDDPPLVGAIGQTFSVPRTVLLDAAGRKVLDLKGQTDFRVIEAKVKQLLPTAPSRPGGPGAGPGAAAGKGGPSATAAPKGEQTAGARARRGGSSTGAQTRPRALSAPSFRAIKRFTLARGDRQTYCKMYKKIPTTASRALTSTSTPRPGSRTSTAIPRCPTSTRS